MSHAEPIPLALHPFKGLLQTVCGILIALLFTALCWLAWSLVASHRLQAQIDAIAALGQPFREKDFALTHLAEADNGAPLWKAVFSAYPTNDICPANNNFAFNDYPPFSAQWEQLEDQSISSNANFLALVHQAAAKPVDWGDAGHSPDPLVPHFFNASRGTANILGDAILHAHLHGDDALAMQRTQDLIQLARAVGSVHTLIGRLVCDGIQSLCHDRLMCIAPDLVLEGEAPVAADPGQRAAPRRQVETVIRSLLDESNDIQARVDVMDWERNYTHHFFEADKTAVWTLGPLIDLSEARVLRVAAVDRLAVAAPSETAAAAVYLANSKPAMGSGAANLGNPGPAPSSIRQWAGVYEDPAWSLSHYVHVEWIRAAESRCCAISLAIRMYRVDHHGAWPAALAQLVPAYLPAVPADPFAPTPSPIGYIIRKGATPDGQDRPMLYFNLAGNPATASLPPNPNFAWGHTFGWRDLSRWYPPVAAAQPATGSPPQAGNH